eukprot:15365723-Ditylum_brightwellii.AAC.2
MDLYCRLSSFRDIPLGLIKLSFIFLERPCVFCVTTSCILIVKGSDCLSVDGSTNKSKQKDRRFLSKDREVYWTELPDNREEDLDCDLDLDLFFII